MLNAVPMLSKTSPTLSAEPLRRSGWLDAWRGLALLLMVTFHAWWVLRQWYGYRFPGSESGLVGWVGGAAALSFFLVSGASTWFSFARYRAAAAPPAVMAAKFIRRSVKIWLAALLVTLTTSQVAPLDTVWFGTLHFLSAGSFLLAWLLMRMPPDFLPVMAVVVLILGLAAELVRPEVWWLIPLGAAPAAFRSLDYYPLLPWFSALLCGAWLAERWRARLNSPLPVALSGLVWLGRRSLPIYLLHVPALFLALELWGRLTS